MHVSKHAGMGTHCVARPVLERSARNERCSYRACTDGRHVSIQLRLSGLCDWYWLLVLPQIPAKDQHEAVRVWQLTGR